MNGVTALGYVTNSEEETEALGARLAEQLGPGAVVAFTGDLGAGKTAFTRGLARGLGIPDRVTSPTFTIVNEYEGGRLPLFHFDMYRLGGLPGPGRRVRRGVERERVRRPGGRRRPGRDLQGRGGGSADHPYRGGGAVKILALESSAAACSAALCRDGALIAQSFQNSGLTHSRTLLPMVDDMLRNCGEALDGVDVIAVAAGPGSFTGLRIGASTAKGLAWAADKPCAPCSTLESMAWPLAHLEGDLIVCAMDARRSQIYNALFWARGDGLERAAPDRALSLAELGAGLKDLPGRKIVVGDGAQLCYNALSEEVPGMVLAPLHLRAQSAWGVARAAERLGEAGGLVPAGDLVPVYLRLSQAERERLERERHTKYTIEGDHSHV